METFIQRHQQDVIGVLSGFDRMRFRGTLRSISYAEGVDRFLGAAGVRYKNFKDYVLGLSQRLLDHGEQVARQAGRPFEYWAKSSEDKQAEALRIAERDGITDGLVCVLRCVEPCMSFGIRRNAQGEVRLRSEQRKCLHLYYYYLDREFGLMHVRVATWLPFGISVCLNGRLDLHPYYWSVSESEYATDVMFRDAQTLARIYPALADHAIKRFESKDVLRFLGRRTNSRFNGEVSTSLLTRSEGVRVKHWLQENSIKMYDKQGSVLRVETTINNARRFKVRKMTVWNGVRRMRWIPMRHAVADLDRRVEISRAANERYLEALAVVEEPSPAGELLDGVSRQVTKDDRPYRALRPVSPQEASVFKVVLNGQFLLKGFTNRDVRQRLATSPPADAQERRRASGRTTRLLRLLRAHGLIRKVSGTRYYRVTPKGQRIMTAALKLRDADVTKLAA